jgi:hypothetical protein
MSELVLNSINAQKAFNKGNKEIKEALKELYPQYDFNADVTSIVTSYEAACEVCGTKRLFQSDFNFLPDQDRASAFASHQIDIIARALNGDCTFDYSNDNQKKWYIWFKWDENAAGGSGFSFDRVDYNYSYSRVGARHSFKDARLAEYAGKNFISIFNQFLKP